MRSLKKLRMVLVLQNMKRKELWRDALEYTDSICKYLKKAALQRTALEIKPELVTEVVAMVLHNHYLSGLTMGAKLLRAVPEDEFPKYSSLTRALLSPTVFDGYAGGTVQAATDLDYVLTSQKVGLSQVDFVRDFTARIWNENAWSRVEKMMKKTENMLVSVSATVNRVYLGSLLQTGHFSKFFLSAVVIAQAAPK
jgi:hypothetical protein